MIHLNVRCMQTRETTVSSKIRANVLKVKRCGWFSCCIRVWGVVGRGRGIVEHGSHRPTGRVGSQFFTTFGGYLQISFTFWGDLNNYGGWVGFLESLDLFGWYGAFVVLTLFKNITTKNERFDKILPVSRFWRSLVTRVRWLDWVWYFWWKANVMETG